MVCFPDSRGAREATRHERAKNKPPFGGSRRMRFWWSIVSDYRTAILSLLAADPDRETELSIGGTLNTALPELPEEVLPLAT